MTEQHRNRGALRTAPTNRAGLGFALAAAVVSGFSVWLNGQVVSRVEVFGDPGTYTTAKNLVAGLVVVAIAGVATLAGSRAGLVRPAGRSHWIGLAAVAVVGGAIPFLLFFEGLAASGSPADAQLLHKAGLLAFVAVLAPSVLRERLGPPQLAGVGLVLLGYWILSGDLGSLGLGSGVLLVLAASACWAAESVIDRWLLADVTPATVAVARLGAGSVVLVVIGLVNGDTARLADLGTTGWAWAALTGLVLAGYAMLWLHGLANAQAVDVTAVLTLAAPITALVNVGIEGTPVPSPTGLVVVAAGGLLVAVAASMRPPGRVQWVT
jgi:drug/metabolite transporter (DMT)-like permease